MQAGWQLRPSLDPRMPEQLAWRDDAGFPLHRQPQLSNLPPPSRLGSRLVEDRNERLLEAARPPELALVGALSRTR